MKDPMKQSERVTKNAAVGLVAAGLGGGLNILCLLILARTLGVHDFGIFSYLLAFAIVFQFAADFGLSNILVREITRHRGDMEHLLGATKGLFWVMFAAAFVLMGLVILLLPVSAPIKTLSWLMGLGYLTLLHCIGYVAVLRACERMEFNALGFIFHKIVLLSAILVSVYFGLGLFGAVCSHVLANICQWLLYHFIVVTRFCPGRLRVDPALWKRLIIEAIPMGGGQVLRQFAWQVDIFIAATFLTSTSLGLFSAPFRLIQGLTLISIVVAVPLFPVFARLAHESKQALEAAYQRSIRWFCMMSFPVMAVCAAWPAIWVRLFLGKAYLPAIPAFHILSFGIVPVFISVLFPYLYCAIHRQTDYLLAMAGAVVLRVILGVILVPRFGLISSCAIVVGVEILLCSGLCYRLWLLGYSPDAVGSVLKPAAGSLLVFLVLSFTRSSPLGWIILSAALCPFLYIGFLWFSQALNPSELALAREGLGFYRHYRARQARKLPS